MSNENVIASEYYEQKGVSRGEFEALKRFGDYEELDDGTLMRMEGDKEFRIYCEDSGWRYFGGWIITRGVMKMLGEGYKKLREELEKDPNYLDSAAWRALNEEHEENRVKEMVRLKASGNWPPENGCPHLIKATKERYAKRQAARQ